MSSSHYTALTVASCDTGFVKEALGHCGTLAGELKDQAGAAAVRYGVIATGEHAGSLLLIQTYSELNGLDRAFDVYAGSSAYSALIGSGKIAVTLRNVVKLEDIGFQPEDGTVPSYGVLTRFGSATPMTEQLAEVAPVFQANGAIAFRYGTLMTGSAAGRRLMGVGYTSMDAIQKTYEALSQNATYMKALAEIDLDFRNIFRYSG